MLSAEIPSQPPSNGPASTLPRIEPVIVWRPQPGPQKAYVDCPLPEVFLGGARGGGKTDAVLGKWALKEKKYGRWFNAIAFRRTTVSFEDAIERAKEIYLPLGAKFVGAPVPHFRMPHGGRVSFRYLESVKDADEFQGRNVTDAWVEEAGQYPEPRPIDRLFGILRSAHGVPIQLTLTANPGGAGQHWIRDRYGLHPFPLGPKIRYRRLANGARHAMAVIPSRIGDNKILIEQDPGYVDRLHLVGSAALVKAWLDGDWSAIEGAFFDCWNEAKHVVAPFVVPKDWLRFRSGDWGSASPFSFGWWAVATDDFSLDGGRTIPRGAIVRYREYYGKGEKLVAETVAAEIARLEKDDPKLTYGVLVPSAFKEDGGPSIAERMNIALIGKKLVSFRPADNTRVPTIGTKDRRGAMGGWDQMRGRLVGVADVPMIYFFSTCVDSIRTIPVLQHDPARAEDLDTNSEDHAADDVRYACMSRPWAKALPKKTPEKQDGYRLAVEDAAEAFGSIATI